MTARRGILRPRQAMNNGRDRVKDEVYRQMFRLEEGRTGAEIGLAVALLHAWMAAGSEPENGKERDWLQTISPICLQMIEATLWRQHPEPILRNESIPDCHARSKREPSGE